MVTATYTDSTTAAVSDYTLSEPNMTTAGSKTVTVSYTEGSVTQSATFTIRVNAPLASISITTQPAKTTYIAGETFDRTGLVVTAYYTDNTTAAVVNYTLSEPDMTTAGPKTVTVSYTEGNLTQTASFTITVNARTGELGITRYYVNERDLAFTGDTPAATAGKAAAGSVTITPAGEGYAGQRWYVNGVEDKAKAGEAAYVFTASPDKNTGTYFIGLRVEKDGVYYYAEYAVTVTE